MDPPSMNHHFVKKSIYIDVDDGIRDDLYWGAISKLWPDIVVEQTGTSKVPPHSTAIVKMKARNTFGTHFCLVKEIRGNEVIIVDSWDGKVKSANAYNGIVGWATYRSSKPKTTPKPKDIVKPLYHKIVKGDTFWALEKKYKRPAGSLQKLNPSKKAHLLQIGDRIRIR